MDPPRARAPSAARGPPDPEPLGRAGPPRAPSRSSRRLYERLAEPASTTAPPSRAWRRPGEPARRSTPRSALARGAGPGSGSASGCTRRCSTPPCTPASTALRRRGERPSRSCPSAWSGVRLVTPRRRARCGCASPPKARAAASRAHRCQRRAGGLGRRRSSCARSTPTSCAPRTPCPLALWPAVVTGQSGPQRRAASPRDAWRGSDRGPGGRPPRRPRGAARGRRGPRPRPRRLARQAHRGPAPGSPCGLGPSPGARAGLARPPSSCKRPVW